MHIHVRLNDSSSFIQKHILHFSRGDWNISFERLNLQQVISKYCDWNDSSTNFIAKNGFRRNKFSSRWCKQTGQRICIHYNTEYCKLGRHFHINANNVFYCNNITMRNAFVSFFNCRNSVRPHSNGKRKSLTRSNERRNVNMTMRNVEPNKSRPIQQNYLASERYVVAVHNYLTVRFPSNFIYLL